MNATEIRPLEQTPALIGPPLKRRRHHPHEHGPPYFLGPPLGPHNLPPPTEPSLFNMPQPRHPRHASEAG